MTENKIEEKITSQQPSLSTSSLSPTTSTTTETAIPSNSSSSSTPQFEESENLEEKKYLLDNKQFSKFGRLLGEKKNSAFIQKIIDTPLVHSKRYFPISREEYLIIKRFIESSLNEKKKPDPDMNLSSDTSTTPSMTTTTPPSTQLTSASSSTTPVFSHDQVISSSSSALPSAQISSVSSPPPSVMTISPSTTSPITTPVSTPASSSTLVPPSVFPKLKIGSKSQVWQPSTWEAYVPKSVKK